MMCGADRGEVDAKGAEGATSIGAADRVYRDRLGIAGERFAAEIAAPADVARPGGAVGPPRAVAAGAHGVLGGTCREVGEFRCPPGAVGDDQIPKQGLVQDERPLPCPAAWRRGVRAVFCL